MRLAKLEALRDAGANPYPYRFDRSHTLAELRAAHGDLAAGHRDRRAGGRGRSAHAHPPPGQADLRHHAGPRRRGPAVRLAGRCSATSRTTAFDALDLGDWVGRRGHGDDHPQGRAVGEGRPLRAAGQGRAPAARQVEGPDRHRHPLPPALRRPHRQRGGPAGVRGPPRGRRLVPPHAGRPRLHRGRDADPPRRGRWRPRPPVRHPPQHPRHRPLPAHRPRAAPQAADRRRHGAGVRDRPGLPQRGHLDPAQPRVHDDGAVPGLRRLQRRHGHHRDADRAGGARRRSAPRSCSVGGDAASTWPSRGRGPA